MISGWEPPSPDANLHVEETNGTTAGRTLLKLKNNGGIFIADGEYGHRGQNRTVAQENASPNRFLITSGRDPDFILDGSRAIVTTLRARLTVNSATRRWIPFRLCLCRRIMS